MKKQIKTNTNIQNGKNDQQFREYESRWVTFAGYIIITLTYSAVQGVFNAINSQVSKIYDINPVVVSLNTLASNITFLPMSFVASFLMQKIGLRFTIWVSCAMMVAALWIRLLINHEYYSVLGAHILLGIGLPLNQNMMNNLPIIWFKQQNRRKIFLFCMLGLLLGQILSSILPGLMLNGYDIDQDALNNYSGGRDKIYQIVCIEAYIGTPLAFIGCIMFQEKPPTPPSIEADKEKQPFGPQVKQTLKNKNYLLLFASYGIFSGCTGGASVVLSYILTSFGYGSEVTTYCSNVATIAGVIGLRRGMRYLKKNPNYKKHLIASVLVTAIGYGIAIPILPIENQPLLILPYAVIGLLAIHSSPLFLMLSSELTYPVDPSISGGLLSGSASLMNFVFGETYSAIMINETKTRAILVYIIQVICLGIALLILLPLNIQLNRTEAEIQIQQQQEIQIQQQQEIQSQQLNKNRRVYKES
ncbi:hypothetical protein ABPG72_007074 [Tetrahymena utriculariae]